MKWETICPCLWHGTAPNARLISQLLPCDGDHLLADVAAGEEPHECCRRRLDPLGDVLHADDLAFLEVPRHLLLEPAVVAGVLGHQEALHADVLADELEEVDAVRPLQVVLRHLPAHGDPAAVAHVAQDGVQHRAAHVLEVDVDAIREAPNNS